MSELPDDWQQFFAKVGTGATFGLFELGERGEQPVLLINAEPDMRIPSNPALATRLEWYEEQQVIRLTVGMLEASQAPEAQLEAQITARGYRVRMEVNSSLTLRFQAFLNPTSQEDRAILAKLGVMPDLNISMVQNNKVLWGKRFPWQSSFKESIRYIMTETKGVKTVDPEMWEQAKEQVMREHPL